jgi:MYXO-CTERM domain-containing protein
MIEGLSATSGQPGSALQIFGQNLQMNSRVIFGSQVVAASGQGDQVSFTVPSLANGSYTLVLESPDGQIATSSYTISGSATAAPPPPPSETGLVASARRDGGSGSTSSGSGGGSSGSSGGGGGGGCSLGQSPSAPPSGAVFLALALFGLIRLRRRG